MGAAQARGLPLAVAVLALSIRAAVLAHSGQGEGAWNLAPDSSRYLALADSLRENGAFRLPDSQGVSRPEYLTLPAYPLLLAGFKTLGLASVWPVLLVQGLAGAATAGVVTAMASAMGGLRAGLFAGLVASFDPQSIAYANLVLTDALSMSAVLLAFAALFRTLERRSAGSACLAGLAVALATFIRPASIVLLLIGTLAFLGATFHRPVQGPRPGRRVLARLPVFLLVGFIPVMAWSARNHAHSGTWFYTTSGDVVLLRWQLPRLLAEAEGMSLDRARARVAAGLEIEDIYPRLGVTPPATYRKRARAWTWKLVAAHPAAFLRLYGAGLARVCTQPDGTLCQVMGQPVVERGLAVGKIGLRDAIRQRWAELSWGTRLLYFLQFPYLGALWLLGAAGAWAGLRRRGARVRVLILAVGIALFILVSGGYPGDPRYRLQAIPLLILLASAGVASRQPLRPSARATACRG